MHDKPKLEPKFEIKPKIELEFFFGFGFWFFLFANSLEVLSMLKIVQQHMINLSSNSSFKFYINSSLIFVLVFGFLFFQKCFKANLGIKSDSAMHDEPKFKLGFEIRLKLELDFYFFKCLRATLGANSSLMVHDEPELKLGFEIGPEFEPIYLFILVFFLQVLLNYS